MAYLGVVAAPEVSDGLAVALSPLAVPGVEVVPLEAPASTGGLTAPAAPPALSEVVGAGAVVPGFTAPELMELFMSAPGAAPVLAAALVLVPVEAAVEAMVEPDHQSLLARCFGEAAI